MNYKVQLVGDYEYMLSDFVNGMVTFYYREIGAKGWSFHRDKISFNAADKLRTHPEYINKVFKANTMDKNKNNMPFQLIEFWRKNDRNDNYTYNGGRTDVVQQGKNFGEYYDKTENEYCRITREYGTWRKRYRDKMRSRKPMSEFSIDY